MPPTLRAIKYSDLLSTKTITMDLTAEPIALYHKLQVLLVDQQFFLHSDVDVRCFKLDILKAIPVNSVVRISHLSTSLSLNTAAYNSNTAAF